MTDHTRRRHRRTFAELGKPTLDAVAEVQLTRADKRRLAVAARDAGVAEAALVRRLLLTHLDGTGIEDPGDPAASTTVVPLLQAA